MLGDFEVAAGGRVRELRDRALARDVEDVLAHDPRTARLELAVAVRGGVVHLRGAVPTRQALGLVGQLVRRVRGVLALWDLVEVEEEGRPPRVADLGCGRTKQAEAAVGVDRYPSPVVNVLADLERPLPFADASLDHVFAVHVLEHVRDMVALMNEIHRVLRPGGRLHAMGPYWRHVHAVADPTHVRGLSPQTFKYFCQDRPGIRPFRPLAVAAEPDTVHADLEPVKAGDLAPDEELLARFFA